MTSYYRYLLLENDVYLPLQPHPIWIDKREFYDIYSGIFLPLVKHMAKSSTVSFPEHFILLG